MSRFIGDGVDAVLVAGGSDVDAPEKRKCNKHDDCDAADAAGTLVGRKPYHCHADDCEECFGC